jgi:hypothetical protein
VSGHIAEEHISFLVSLMSHPLPQAPTPVDEDSDSDTMESESMEQSVEQDVVESVLILRRDGSMHVLPISPFQH